MWIERSFRATILCLFLGSGAVAAQETCEMPREGIWRMSTGQTRTIMGPGGGPDGQEFQLSVEECGETLVLTGFGSPETGNVKRLARQEDQSYAVRIPYRGIAYVSWSLQTTSPETFTLKWTFGVDGAGGAAWSDGGAALVTPAAVGRVDPRCDCKPFLDQLRERIESARFFENLYSNPVLHSSPSNMPQARPWRTHHMEYAIDLVATQDLTPAAAVAAAAEREANGWQRAAGMGGSSSAPSAPSGSSGKLDSPSPISVASTNCQTCKVEVSERPTGCAADVLETATLAHEEVHATACRDQRRARESALTAILNGERVAEPSTYCVVTNEPKVLAAEEIRAYAAEIAHIRQSYQRMCGRPLN
ncbi:hypothetical protein [Pontitalea aquivivens]|uniref:hypothetical protein n=1 Tax=Pontitalea aquivivens TaxID=3388663 RepID=UPI003970D53C